MCNKVTDGNFAMDSPFESDYLCIIWQEPAVKATWIPDDLHITFMMSFATGTPNYDAAFQAQLQLVMLLYAAFYIVNRVTKIINDSVFYCSNQIIDITDWI